MKYLFYYLYNIFLEKNQHHQAAEKLIVGKRLNKCRNSMVQESVYHLVRIRMNKNLICE